MSFKCNVAVTPRWLLVGLLLAVAIVAPSTASAATYLHDSTSSGNVLASGDTISTALKSGTSAVWTTSTGNITCSVSTISLSVGASGGSAVQGTVLGFEIGVPDGDPRYPACSSPGGAWWDYCTLAGGTAPPATFSSSSSTGGTLVIGSSTSPLQMTCWQGSTQVCTLTSTGSAGTYTNSVAELRFSNVAQSFTFPCPSSGNSWSATYSPVVVDATGGNMVVNNTP